MSEKTRSLHGTLPAAARRSDEQLDNALRRGGSGGSDKSTFSVVELLRCADANYNERFDIDRDEARVRSAAVGFARRGAGFPWIPRPVLPVCIPSWARTQVMILDTCFYMYAVIYYRVECRIHVFISFISSTCADNTPHIQPPGKPSTSSTSTATGA